MKKIFRIGVSATLITLIVVSMIPSAFCLGGFLDSASSAFGDFSSAAKDTAKSWSDSASKTYDDWSSSAKDTVDSLTDSAKDINKDWDFLPFTNGPDFD